MEKKQIRFDCEAPYYKVGTIGHTTKAIWMIFHGYGQLAEQFMHRFSIMNPEQHIMIFPQGLSKFYLKGIDNQVGASWMTAHDREYDIQNYLAYLREIYQSEVLPYSSQYAFNVLGFSQGAHTASRWIYREHIAYDKLILWGANLAHEINAETVTSYFSGGRNIFVIGDQDRYIDDASLEKLQQRYNNMGMKYELIRYQGGHDIYPDVLEQLL